MELARSLTRARHQALTGTIVPGLRALVTASWERAAQAGVDPEHHQSPLHLEPRDVRERWSGHPLHRFAPMVQELLCDFAYDAQHMVVIADRDGCILWTGGHPKVLAASETISFSPGHGWHEDAVGTNGVGTAIALDHAVQIFSAEHYNFRIRAWTCSGAPIHDPETNEVLGVVDVSSGIRAAHPHSLALVSAAAHAVETVLLGELQRRNFALRAEFYERAARYGSERTALVDRVGRVIACHPPGWLTGPLLSAGEGAWVASGSTDVLVGEPLPGGSSLLIDSRRRAPSRSRVRLRALGRRRAEVVVDDLEIKLSPRHSELMVLMVLHPDGLTARDLAAELFGDPTKLMSARAEVSRLRRQLVGLIATQPYRLLAEVDADFLAPPPDGGALLPGAGSPSIARERERLGALV